MFHSYNYTPEDILIASKNITAANNLNELGTADKKTVRVVIVVVVIAT